MRQIIVTNETSGHRLDDIASELFPNLSRTSLQKIIDQGQVYVNDKPGKTSYKTKSGDVITSDFDISNYLKVPKITLPILYEDTNCIVINKPAGLLTHSKGAFNPEPTIATFIEPKLTGLSGERAGIVHRLDRATSGVIICAKNPDALSWLQKQFSERKTKKTYVAIVKSGLEPQHAVIDVPIIRDRKRPKQFTTAAHGKNAQTEYWVEKGHNKYDLLTLKPVTGRTHQLRVHLKYIGYPIVGDTLYDGKVANRLFLHAYKLELTLPNKERKTFTAPVPQEFDMLVKD